MSSPPPALRPAPQTSSQTARIDSNNGHSTPIFGRIYWAPIRSLWFTLMYGGAAIGGYTTFRWDAFALFIMTSAIALCAGYSVGIHRRLIHNSFQCHPWVEALLVYIGVLVGIGGPFALIEQHDIRDWAQSQPCCHDYFIHRRNPLTDWIWTMHCDLQLHYPPLIRYEPKIATNRFYQWLEQTWTFQQLPLAIAFYYLGGWSWVFWGIYVRISVCATLIWLADYLPCHVGHRPLYAKGAAVQRGNIPALGLLTMGESWQNNHQNASYVARFGARSQLDPGWWLLNALSRVGLVWNISTPKQRIVTPASHSTAETIAPITTELPQLLVRNRFRD